METQIDSRVLATLVAGAVQLASADVLTRPDPSKTLLDREAMLAVIDNHFATVLQAYERHNFLLGA